MDGKYDTTSRSYFIKQDDGSVLRYNRVHSTLPEAYKEEDKLIQSRKLVVQELSKLTTKAEVVKWINEKLKDEHLKNPCYMTLLYIVRILLSILYSIILKTTLSGRLS